MGCEGDVSAWLCIVSYVIVGAFLLWLIWFIVWSEMAHHKAMAELEKLHKEQRERLVRKAINQLKNEILDGRINTLERLEDRIASCGKDIDPYEDVLSPIGYSVCDRCGALVPSDEGLLWIDSFGWEDDNPRDQYMLRALAREKANYTAVCWQCVDELGEGYDE